MGRENWKRCVGGGDVAADSTYMEGLRRNTQNIRIVSLRAEDDDKRKK
jgi:hypothetical protein